jgi:flagellar basal body-associated protein FliL
MEQSSPANSTDQNPPPKKKKKHGCCFGCSVILIILLVAILGAAGYFIYKGIPKKSAVEKEYNSIPDYFENH